MGTNNPDSNEIYASRTDPPPPRQGASGDVSQEDIVLDSTTLRLPQGETYQTRSATTVAPPGKKAGRRKKRKKMLERRRYKRIPASETRVRIRLAQLLRLGPYAGLTPCRLDNLSQGGIGLTGARLIKVGKRVVIELRLPDGTQDMLKGRIRAAYPHSRGFRHHVEIVDMPKAVRDWVVRMQGQIRQESQPYPAPAPAPLVPGEPKPPPRP